ncbi:hypothetical protein [Microbulbifer sp.]|uniref:hypothetical protein n=1 Tax=Microbulbifer sp. TaxID=1908541 RepID=UPI003F345C07
MIKTLVLKRDAKKTSTVEAMTMFLPKLVTTVGLILSIALIAIPMMGRSQTWERQE